MWLSFVFNLCLGWLSVFAVLKGMETYLPGFRRLLSNANVLMHPFFFCWSTAWLNTPLQQLGHRYRRGLALWFTVGVAVFPALTLFAVALLVVNVMQRLTRSSVAGLEEPVLQLALPGVNQPLLSFPLYVLFCGVVHEAGHALAAAAASAEISRCGVYLAVLVPGAFVDIKESLTTLTALGRLRIYTAGVWHNLCLVAACIAAAAALPMLLCPLYSVGVGVVVLGTAEGGALSSSISPGDTIVALNRCGVDGRLQLEECLLAEQGRATAYCVPATMLEGVSDECCSGVSSSELCFVEQAGHSSPRRACLRASAVLRSCVAECSAHEAACHAGGHVCIAPTVPPGEVMLALLFVPGGGSPNTPQQHTDAQTLHGRPGVLLATPFWGNHSAGGLSAVPMMAIFLGRPSALVGSVMGTDFKPHAFLPSVVQDLLLGLPDVALSVCWNIASLSLGLAVINALPIFVFDGSHVFRELAARLPVGARPARAALCSALFAACSALLAVNIFVSL